MPCVTGHTLGYQLVNLNLNLTRWGVQVGVPGTVSAIFSTVRDASANVIMISQASSEHSVCFAVKQAQGEQAVAALNARCAAWGDARMPRAMAG